MAHSIEINVAETRLRLLASRGAYWADRRMLLVADTHFGKAATFRRNAIPVPRGSTDGTLRNISAMLASTGARHLVILGDMFHARSSLSAEVRKSLEMFFADHAGIRFTLVRGNHDRNVGPFPPNWPLEMLEPGEKVQGGVALGHQPTDVPEDADVLLCGHLHPSIHFGPRHDRQRLPCFWLSNRRLVFPAIGNFTGTETIRRRGDDRVWMIADDQIFEHKRRTAARRPP